MVWLQKQEYFEKNKDKINEYRVALVRVPFYFINLWLTVTDSHFVHIYTTYVYVYVHVYYHMFKNDVGKGEVYAYEVHQVHEVKYRAAR